MRERGQSLARWLRPTIAWLVFAVCLLGGGASQAHETPVALLRLNEVRPGSFVESWTYSSSRNLSVPTPSFPEHCAYAPPRLDCGSKGLVGPITVSGLGERYSAAVIRITALDGVTQSFTVTAATPVHRVGAGGALSFFDVAKSYLPLGVEHILLGVDHLLFVAGLMLLVATRWMLLKTITAFTVAHSLTLAGVTLGWVGVAERPVNAAIALSIVFVAVDLVRKGRGQLTWTVRWPWAVAFGFGLLHGFGFAGALSKIGLPQENLVAALLFFNVGVELGQLGFVLLVLALVASHRQLQTRLPRWGQPAAVYAMGSVASFWFVTRLWAMLETVWAS